MSSSQANIARIRAVNHALGDLAASVVYIGGAVVSLYSSRPAYDIRPTDDVDVLLEVASYDAYMKIDDTLRKKGFENDVESGVICRYRINGIIVDVMPIDEKVLGFTNSWYETGFAGSQQVEIDPGLTIYLFQPIHFLASKIEAFHSRGGGDGRMSTDFDDIVYLLNNREQICDEINASPEKERSYIQQQFRIWADSPYIDEWVSCHLEHHEQRRLTFIKGGIVALSGAAT
jgi:predicted nucleotidyltransferase